MAGKQERPDQGRVDQHRDRGADRDLLDEDQLEKAKAPIATANSNARRR